MPNLTKYKEVGYTIIDEVTGGNASKYVGDIQASSGVLIGMTFGTLLIAFIYVLLLKYIAGPLTAIALIALLLI